MKFPDIGSAPHAVVAITVNNFTCPPQKKKKKKLKVAMTFPWLFSTRERKFKI